MKIRIMFCGLLVVLATLLVTTPAPSRKSGANCDDLIKNLRILEDKRNTYEAQRAQAQKRIDDDRRNGRPIRQEDIDAVNAAKAQIELVDESIKDAQDRADPSCKKEETCQAIKGMVWSKEEKRCVHNRCVEEQGENYRWDPGTKTCVCKEVATKENPYPCGIGQTR